MSKRLGLTKKEFEEYREILKIGKCKNCQEGRFDLCQITEAQFKRHGGAFIQRPDGTRKYFCNLGCAVLILSNREMDHVANAFVSPEGHYEQLRNAVNEIPSSRLNKYR